MCDISLALECLLTKLKFSFRPEIKRPPPEELRRIRQQNLEEEQEIANVSMSDQRVIKLNSAVAKILPHDIEMSMI